MTETHNATMKTAAYDIKYEAGCSPSYVQPR